MKILSLTLVYDLRFFLFFSLFFAHNSARSNNPSLRLISPQTIHKKKKKKKYESTNTKYENHQSPSTERPTRRANRKIENIKGSRKAGRSSKSLENNSTLALYLVQPAIWQCSHLSCLFLSILILFLSLISLSLSLSLCLCLCLYRCLPLSLSFLHFFFPPSFSFNRLTVIIVVVVAVVLYLITSFSFFLVHYLFVCAISSLCIMRCILLLFFFFCI